MMLSPVVGLCSVTFAYNALGCAGLLADMAWRDWGSSLNKVTSNLIFLHLLAYTP